MTSRRQPASRLDTLARIDAACADGEKRSDFIREAVERELKRRGK
jgi:metal-responsive CopG/Arc/MetJ family transcriptional regulator